MDHTVFIANGNSIVNGNNRNSKIIKISNKTVKMHYFGQALTEKKNGQVRFIKSIV